MTMHPLHALMIAFMLIMAGLNLAGGNVTTTFVLISVASASAYAARRAYLRSHR
jgi:hypothetical protein